MKKSELKSLLKIIVEEVQSATKKSRMDETKGLSGFKKSKDSTEHTEKIATSKDLTGATEPKEKEEGKKLPVVKKPSNPQKVGDLKEEIMEMIRESIAEMARTAGSIGNKYKVQDPSSPTGWIVKGHKTIPDGTPTEAPSMGYEKKGTNPNLGRPKKAADDVEMGGDDDEDDDEAAPEAVGSEANSKVRINIDGDDIGEMDLAKIKGPLITHLSSVLRANDVVLKPEAAVKEKLDQFGDMWSDDKLPYGATLNLSMGTDSIKLV